MAGLTLGAVIDLTPQCEQLSNGCHSLRLALHGAQFCRPLQGVGAKPMKEIQ
ncbi:hypothetical protein [Pseudomonas putida]|uniref:hypothetical protein n=1 Tax=Pseudomonas putida TaxID=303 RepID=UPI0018A93308|nr:hypothetical protein [Pseudomonas putida]MBF8659688.1 hypothetical protein [Pseudomonas putida]